MGVNRYFPSRRPRTNVTTPPTKRGSPTSHAVPFRPTPWKERRRERSRRDDQIETPPPLGPRRHLAVTPRSTKGHDVGMPATWVQQPSRSRAYMYIATKTLYVAGYTSVAVGGTGEEGKLSVVRHMQRSSHRPTLHPLSKFGGGDRPLEPRGAVVPCWCYRYTALVASCVSRGHVLGLSGGHCCQLLNLRKYLWTGLPFDVEKVGKRYLCSTSQPCTRRRFNTAPI